jgi:hypothetical protein
MRAREAVHEVLCVTVSLHAVIAVAAAVASMKE